MLARAAPGRRRGPSLIDASRLAGRIVWRSARKPFLVSTLAEGVAAVGLAGVLLFGRDLATALTGEPPVDELRDVLPEALGLAGALLVSGVATIVVRQVRWLVAEQVTRHVKEEIGAVASSVDYERYEEAEFHDLLSRSEEQASESSYQLVYDLLSLVNILGTSVVVLMVLVGAVPEVLAGAPAHRCPLGDRRSRIGAPRVPDHLRPDAERSAPDRPVQRAHRQGDGA